MFIHWDGTFKVIFVLLKHNSFALPVLDRHIVVQQLLFSECGHENGQRDSAERRCASSF